MNENCIHGIDVANIYCPECGKHYRDEPKNLELIFMLPIIGLVLFGIVSGLFFAARYIYEALKWLIT